MKHLQLAIASIVDANTGHGLVRGSKTDYRQVELRARLIRSKTVHALLGAISGTIRNAVAEYRETARQRKAVADLSNLSDHYLEDIGLTRGDIIAVKLGQASLEELNADRRARLAVAPLDTVATHKLGTAAGDAVNAADYSEAACA